MASRHDRDVLSRRRCCLLAGVTLNSFFSALILFVQYMSDFAQTYRTVRWLMGDLDVGGFHADRRRASTGRSGVRVFALLPSSLNLLSVGGGCGGHSRR
jgi:iron complex transport system permease protein